MECSCDVITQLHQPPTLQPPLDCTVRAAKQTKVCIYGGQNSLCDTFPQLVVLCSSAPAAVHKGINSITGHDVSLLPRPSTDVKS